MTQKPVYRLLRTVAILILLTGAILSAVLTWDAGRKNASVILPAMFLIWVLSPFMVLLFAGYRFKRYAEHRYISYYLFLIVLSVFSVIAYSGVLNPANVKTAAVFLFTPLLSWVLIIIGAVVLKRSAAR